MEPALIEEFRQRGVVVVPEVLSRDEVSHVRSGFHAFLLDKGCDVTDLERTGRALSSLSSTGGAGGILDVFWADWKLFVLEHPAITAAFSALWSETFASGDTEHFEHRHGAFDPASPIAAVDRICYRLPDSISKMHSFKKGKGLQRHLAPHLDCCPHQDDRSAAAGNGNETTPHAVKWRPVQAFIALTDNPYPSEQGGFECCPGLHRKFKEWAECRPPSILPQIGKKSNYSEQVQTNPPCLGAFTPMRPKEDADILSRFEPIPCRAGDLVMWDNRIPHANARVQADSAPREVVYIGMLPPVSQNLEYAHEQLQRFRDGRFPVDFWHGRKESALQPCEYNFSKLGRRLMRIEGEEEEVGLT